MTANGCLFFYVALRKIVDFTCGEQEQKTDGWVESVSEDMSVAGFTRLEVEMFSFSLLLTIRESATAHKGASGRKTRGTEQ